MPWHPHFSFDLYAIIGWCIGFGLAFRYIRRPQAQKLSRERMMTSGTYDDNDEEARLETADEAEDDGVSAAWKEAEVETIRLLITGYGPFRGYPTENPSTLTARHLDGLVLETPGKASLDGSGRRQSRNTRRRRVDVTFRSLAVTYAEVDSVVPPLHSEHAYDAFIHVGVASRAKDGLRLEQLGRRGPYDAVDSEKRHCSTDSDGKRTVPGWMVEKDEIKSSLDLPALLAWLKGEKAVEHVLLSLDAGLYLCEYVYATSLNAAQQAAKHRGPYTRPAPCLFVHVPDLRPADVPPSADLPVYTEREVADVLRDVCAWVGGQV